MSDKLPDNFTRIGREESFRFACHPGIACFTECCRELDLALTPYDVLRLRKRLSMDSAAFMERYVIIEQNPDLILPQCYLTMVDDGWASCVFVSPAGCTVYPDRPSACRAYPVGRGAALSADGTVQETFVLVREEHCRGFAESEVHNPNEYFSDQGLHDYNRFNDALLAFRQHPALKKGHPLSPVRPGRISWPSTIRTASAGNSSRADCLSNGLFRRRTAGPCRRWARTSCPVSVAQTGTVRRMTFPPRRWDLKKPGPCGGQSPLL